MSTPFFSKPHELFVLGSAAAQWKGTPFAHYGAVPGEAGGVSCHCLAGAIYAAAGFDVGEPLPRFRVNRGRQHVRGVMLDWLRSRGTLFQEITPATVENVLPGDLLVANIDGPSAHHCGVALPGGVVIHALKVGGVQITSLQDPLLSTVIVGIFRPLAK